MTLWAALTGTSAYRTLDLLWRLVDDGIVDEADAQETHRLLRTDALHNLGGPIWGTRRSAYETERSGQ